MPASEIVIDANVAAKWYFRSENYRAKAKDLLTHFRKGRFTLIAPPIFHYEFESVVQRKLATRIINLEDADNYLKHFYTIPILLQDDAELISKAREIARLTRQARIYDSLYAGLAKLRGCEFWTADRAFYEAARGQLASVQFLADYN